jgi:hypothetical protein
MSDTVTSSNKFMKHQKTSEKCIKTFYLNMHEIMPNKNSSLLKTSNFQNNSIIHIKIKPSNQTYK